MNDKSAKKVEKIATDSLVGKNIAIDDTAFENRAMDSVFKLSKVQKLKKYYDSLSVDKNGISMMVIKRPVSDTDYYVVQVGHDTKERFIGIYNFLVYKRGLEIKYSDPKTGKIISLADWNKEQGF